METAIERLPSAYRSVVMLRDVEGLSTEETADCLGIPTATVKTRLHRGHALLRQALGSTLGATPSELFAFGFSRCDRLVRLVLQRIDPSSGITMGEAYYRLGLIHFETNEKDKARGMFQRALDIEPHNQTFKQALARL